MKRADAFLAQSVDADGRFHYERADAPENLDSILTGVAEQDPQGFESRHHELAFFLNAYNLAALAIAARWYRRSRGIRRRGLGGWWARFRFFFLERVTVAGRRRTLFGLEFLTIRRRFKDPRIHFALVCATGSCPPLRDGLFSGTHVDQELDHAARAFLRPNVGYKLDRDRNRVTFNRIFRWYAKDFARIGGALGALERWGPKPDAQYVRRHGPRVGFAKYDWHLNQAGELTIHSEPRPAAPPRREHSP
ncbi:MAG: DUF547 domain-containing protein [Euryarchaeota archaeon]|nr:DUF547 domain-containing protein [Euryarchaeota archaeon]